MSNPVFLPFLPEGPNTPDNEEIAARLAQHVGTATEEHGFGNLTSAEVAAQIEDLLNRASAGDKTLLMKTIREGTASEARVIFDQNTGLMVTVNPSAPGFGTAIGDADLTQYYNFGK